MSYDSSMMYTMGTALNHALQDKAEVSVLVEGQWLTGSVVLYDGVGVVLDHNDNHSIVRVDNISAIKVLSRLPWQSEISEGEAAVAPSWEEPMPMPGPRSPQDG